MKNIFVIWGMHRGGTSLLAAAMQVFGAGFAKDLLDADQFNPKGYFESQKLISLNDAFLKALGLNWSSLGLPDKEQSQVLERVGALDAAVAFLREQPDSVILKDPRMCKLVHLWRKAFQKAGLNPLSVIVWRNPYAVAQSLARRDNVLPISRPVRNQEYGQFLWLSYTLAALHNTAGLQRVLVNYDSFIINPASQLKAIGQIFNISPKKDILMDFCSDFIDKSLNHGVTNRDNILPGNVLDLYDLLNRYSQPIIPENESLPPIWPHTLEEHQLVSIIDSQADHARIIEKNILMNQVKNSGK